MKNIITLFVLFILLVSYDASSQDKNSNWAFGAALGVNSFGLNKGNNSNFAIFTERESKVKQEAGRLSIQGYATSKYKINNRWQILGSLGLVFAKNKATRRNTETTSLFSTQEITILDTLSQKYALLEIPIYARWQIISADNQKYNLKPFLDLGFSIKIPLSQETSFRREENTFSDPIFGGPINSSQFFSGGLKTQPLSIYFALGFLVAKHSSIAFTWSGLYSQAELNKEITYSSSLLSLTFTHFLMK
mgnify:CR=1 FL=1